MREPIAPNILQPLSFLALPLELEMVVRGGGVSNQLGLFSPMMPYLMVGFWDIEYSGSERDQFGVDFVDVKVWEG